MNDIRIIPLANQPDYIDPLVDLWEELLGRPWLPEANRKDVISSYQAHLNTSKLPLTYVALKHQKAIGMCSLRDNDGIRSDLSPWLGSLVVDKHHQRHGVGQALIDETKATAKSMGYDTLHLFAFDPEVVKYYIKLGWVVIGSDTYNHHPVTVMNISL